MQTPVLLILYKRPELTRGVLRTLAAARPAVLLVAADGPSRPEEADACAQARAVIEEVDWDCQVLTNFSDTNLGCGIRVYTAIDWALSLFEEIIVLEDDCVPNPSFFRFCDAMLAEYRDDERVMHVSGNNFFGGGDDQPYSYYFSKYTHAWGWATWRRAWRHFDWSVARWPELEAAGLLEAACSDPYEREYWRAIFTHVHAGAPDIWDYQWNFICWSQSGLAVMPHANLVTNLGFGEDATHTKEASEFLSQPTSLLGAIRHPPYVIRDAAADALTFARNFGGDAMKARDLPAARIRRSLEPILRPLRGVKRGLRKVTGL